MSTKVKKQKVTLMLDTQVYQGLLAKFGARGIGSYLSFLARPYVVESALEDGYKAMAADAEREREAQEWQNGFTEPEIATTEEVWQF